MTAWSAITTRFKHHAVDTRPLRIASFRRQLVGQGTSFVGAMLTQVAVPVQVYDLSNSSLQVGLVGLVGLLPLVFFGLYGGAIADVMDRRTLYLISSLGAWAVTLGLFAQTAAGIGSVPLILALVAVQSAFFAIASAARGAIIPRIVEPDLVPAANTLSFTVGNLGQVLGPLIAGVLVTRHHGFDYAYAADALLFTVALYAALRLPSMPPDGTAPRAGFRSVVQGLSFIAGEPVLLMSFAVDIVAMVFAMPRALYPEVAAERWHGQVGPLYAAIAIGAVVAGLSSGWIGRIRRQGVALTIAISGWGLCVAASGLAHQLWLVVMLLAVAGAADLVSAVYRQTILQTYAPDAMRGRMQGVFIVVVAGGPRLGDLRSGATASATSVTFSWVAGGLVCVIAVAVAALVVRPFWRYDAQAAIAGSDLPIALMVAEAEPGLSAEQATIGRNPG
ncbi:MFS transporter [Jatrophihabitans telluris]|uniref:MFS transporter n=1 Tax=Jatrophihabitans telluris TaxID=2038343 RepID=A0ABY4R077_9ACTN|nr:MFS transporter [Jatrophihabitans telluris]UQX89144.1 MFS transporter [Jatrophihabitans telluris]